jgi:hypothetical protein
MAQIKGTGKAKRSLLFTPQYDCIERPAQEDLAHIGKGGQSIDPTYNCISPGMPRVMIAYSLLEFAAQPDLQSRRPAAAAPPPACGLDADGANGRILSAIIRSDG